MSDYPSKTCNEAKNWQSIFYDRKKKCEMYIAIVLCLI